MYGGRYTRTTMCGIYGVTGNTNHAGSDVFAGLQELEYRGYDSWGIAEKIDQTIVIKKQIGKISESTFEHHDSSEAIGHSRWATHGAVNWTNAHPHCVGFTTVVHNGIIDNYVDIKKRMQAIGYGFVSETDTEVLAALLDYHYNRSQSARQAVVDASCEIDGRWAFLCIFEDEPGLYAGRNGSPLIVGIGDESCYIASDIPAFGKHTQTVNYLDNNQGCFVHGPTRTFFSLDTNEDIVKDNIVVDYTHTSVDKGTYDHYMIKEIFQQPEIINYLAYQDVQLLQQAVDICRTGTQIYLVGCGTAHKVAMVGQSFLSEIAGVNSVVVPASEMDTWVDFVDSDTVVIAISQSGETADVLDVIEQSQSRRATIISVTNVDSSTLARMSQVVLPIMAGTEKAVASTKAATAQMVILYRMATMLSSNDNKSVGDIVFLAKNLDSDLDDDHVSNIRNIAEKISQWEHLFILGKHALYPIALEAAIKIQEVSYIHAQGFAAGEIKHGPIALIDSGTPCIILGDDEQIITSAQELRARGAYIIGISPSENDAYDYWIPVSDCGDLNVISVLIPLQLLAYYLALQRDVDPDMPRNLAKSVTVK